jgi:hypothetical protein
MYLDCSVHAINVKNSEQIFIVCLCGVCVKKGVAHHQSSIRSLEEGLYKTLW